MHAPHALHDGVLSAEVAPERYVYRLGAFVPAMTALRHALLAPDTMAYRNRMDAHLVVLYPCLSMSCLTKGRRTMMRRFAMTVARLHMYITIARMKRAHTERAHVRLYRHVPARMVAE